MKDSKFSVVIPLYNKRSYIGRAICSVLNQTCQDFELIIVDDGSTDDSANVVKECKDSRITLIQQNNAGVSAARNRGIEEASGDLIAFLDADDEWKPVYLNTIRRLVMKFPNAGIYTTAYEIMTASDKIKTPDFKVIPSSQWEGIMPSYFKSAALGLPPVCASTACVPQKVFCDVGKFRIGKRMGEDLDMWGRIAIKYPVVFSQTVGAVYYQNIVNSACKSFCDGDNHPFIDTVQSLDLNEPIVDTWLNIELYVGRLKLNDARQNVLSGNYQRARELLAGDILVPFGFRKFLWGSQFNQLTHLVWVLKTQLSDFFQGIMKRNRGEIRAVHNSHV